jgi:hypothetical protein
LKIQGQNIKKLAPNAIESVKAMRTSGAELPKIGAEGVSPQPVEGAQVESEVGMDQDDDANGDDDGRSVPNGDEFKECVCCPVEFGKHETRKIKI